MMTEDVETEKGDLENKSKDMEKLILRPVEEGMQKDAPDVLEVAESFFNCQLKDNAVGSSVNKKLIFVVPTNELEVEGKDKVDKPYIKSVKMSGANETDDGTEQRSLKGWHRIPSSEGGVFQFSGIYVFRESQQKWRTWDLIRSLKRDPPIPWLCCGDFNEFLSPDDKQGCQPVNILSVDSFRQALDDCALEDLGFVGQRFTWSNKRRMLDNVEERLDKGVANMLWRRIWARITVSTLPRFFSDYNPIVIAFSKKSMLHNERRKQRLYRFERIWLTDDECEEIVYRSWLPSGTVPHKVASVEVNLIKWGKKKFENLAKLIKAVQQRL
ncbi:hypothetical protein RIF29_29648 [Crotalaria pallida]|uniref:Endonuclease/exonuclease/phosphatase domain-containing protein n=1 Tax=Crotalaria pallida TaxID=3830 RepID=A0AAN9HXM8_CROPI